MEKTGKPAMVPSFLEAMDKVLRYFNPQLRNTSNDILKLTQIEKKEKENIEKIKIKC